MSQSIKQTFETYNPKEYRTKVTVKRAIIATSPWQIPTLEGVMRAEPGDYIIEGVNGEYYPCKPDVFKKSYEPCGWDLEGSNRHVPLNIDKDGTVTKVGAP